MVKRAILTLVQFAAFLGLLFIGGDWDFINLQSELRQLQAGNLHPHVLIPTIKYPISANHILIANGLIYSGVLLVLILLFLALRRRLKPWASLSVLAWILAVFFAFATKMGLPPAS